MLCKRKCQAVFPKWLYRFVFPPAMNESFYCSTTSQNEVIPVFQTLAILIGGSGYLDAVLVCTFRTTYGVEYLFICSFAICVSSWRSLVRSFGPFFNWVFAVVVVVFLSLGFRVCVFWIIVLHRLFLLKIFSPSLWVTF